MTAISDTDAKHKMVFRNAAGPISPALGRAIALAACLILLTAVSGSAAEPATAGVSEESKTQAIAHPQGPIAVPDVATRAMEVADLIRNFTAKLAADGDLEPSASRFQIRRGSSTWKLQ
jgi:hypothetical protein